jgi:hypothetical protein
MESDAVGSVTMTDSRRFPPLKALHPDSSLNAGKLAKYARLSTEDLLASLLPTKEGCLKTRPDGTILDGHHRIYVLRKRGVEVDGLPRENVTKEPEES